jgi:hypothetical protein
VQICEICGSECSDARLEEDAPVSRLCALLRYSPFRQVFSARSITLDKVAA